MNLKFLIYSILFITFAFLVFRVIVRNDYLKKYKLSFFSYSLELIVFVIHANFIYMFIPLKWPDLPSFPENIILRFLSFFFICVGLVILIISWFSLGTKASFGQDENKLRTTGIYRYSRNPQLVAYGIILIVFSLIFSSYYSLGWFILYIIIAFFMIKSEEEFLGLAYGKEYEKYCQFVPRIGKFF
jgi:protein-S-isoprenylcysteine O-methyltransferase Ste14